MINLSVPHLLLFVSSRVTYSDLSTHFPSWAESHSQPHQSCCAQLCCGRSRLLSAISYLGVLARPCYATNSPFYRTQGSSCGEGFPYKFRSCQSAKWGHMSSPEILGGCLTCNHFAWTALAEMALILFKPSRHCHNIINSNSEGINKR